VGEITATATLAAVVEADLFRNGRQFAAWLGLIPRQRSSGGRQRLGGISKQGDPHLRTLFIHGTRAALQAAVRRDDARARWLKAIIERRGKNRAAATLALAGDDGDLEAVRAALAGLRDLLPQLPEDPWLMIAETPQSLDMAHGTLDEKDDLAALDTEPAVGNLWYLNSDRPAGRITGMTRFATFWVEGGRIVCPVEPMRFDDSIYRMLGENLADFACAPELLLDPSTYGERSTASARLPGALLRSLRLTL
jgi:hypothetical protein